MNDADELVTRARASEARTVAAGRLRRLAGGSELDWLVGGLVLVVYVVVQLAFLLGPQPYDPAKYFDTAVDFPQVPVDLWTLRIGLVGPVYAAVLLFGPSEAALYAVPIATGLLLAGAVYGTMLVLFRGRVLAGAAALVTSLSTPYLLNSSFIFPDTTATATFAAGFFCLVLGGLRPEEREWRSWQTAAVVGAGALFGWTYLIREFSPILLPAVLVAVVLLRYPVHRFALLAGASVATAGLELLYGALRYGEPLVHANRLLARNDAGIRPARQVQMEQIQAELDNLLDTILVFPRLLLSWRSGWLLLLLIVLFVVALALVRDRRLWLLAAWCFSFWAIMAVLGLGSLPSGRWIVNVTNVRYWYPILPPLVMGAFGGLDLLIRRFVPTSRAIRAAPAAASVVAVLMLAPGLAEFRSCAAMDIWRNDPADRWDDLGSWFATPDADRYGVVWTDRATHRLVPAYASSTFGRSLWDGKVNVAPRPRSRIPPSTRRGNSLFLLHKDRFPWRKPGTQRRLEELRRGWTPVFVSGDGQMVLLAHESVVIGGAVNAGQWWTPSLRRTDPPEPGSCGRGSYGAGG